MTLGGITNQFNCSDQSMALLDMATREVARLPADHCLREAARIMAERRISSIVVVDGSNHPVGIVTERDIVGAMHDQRGGGETLRAVMSAPVITVPIAMGCEEAYHLCTRQDIRHLVLVNAEGVLAGVVSETDFRMRMSLTALAGQRRVANIMTRSVLSLPPSASLKVALDHMQAHGDSCVVVVEEDIPIGIVTERDMVRLFAGERAQAGLRLCDVMASPVLTVGLDANVSEAAQFMLRVRSRHLVVLDHDGHLGGMISEHDLTQTMAYGLTDAHLDAERRFLHALVDSIPDLIWLKDPQGIYLACNPRFERLYGAREADIVGKTDYDFVDRAQADAFRAHDLAALARGAPSVNEEWLTFADDGHRELVETIKTPMRDSSGRVVGVLGLARDISRRAEAEARLRLAASVFANSQEGILISDADNRIVDVNPAFSQITGFSREEVLGKNPGLLHSDRHDEEFYAAMWQALREHGSWRGEIWNRRKSGQVFPELLSISVVHDEKSAQRSYVAVFSDISRLKAHEAELDHIAHYDSLTGVPNRLLLGDRLDQSLARARRSGKPLAVCYLDLDGFKPINDEYGHEVGDRLLVAIANHLQDSLRSGDTLARLGGDEFVLLLNDLGQDQEFSHALERVLMAAAKPVPLGDGVLVSVSASVGVTVFPNDDADADTLLRHADQAMYRAKEAGRNRYHLFDPEHDRQIKAHYETLQCMRQALGQQEFQLHYQPKVDMVSGEVLGVEALIRWQHPERGLLLPGEFLPFIDNTDLEIDLGAWVIDTALRQMAAWKAQGLRLPVSVNISAHHLQRGDFSQLLRQALVLQPSVDPADLGMEILESAAIENFDQASRTLSECIAMGVRFALDDFGTGYSSLTYFRRLPASSLKIDQGFVRDMLDDPEDLGIVETVVNLARTFNRLVIAEGVESLEHGVMLVHLGCRQAQGFGIARPMPAEQVAGWVAGWQGVSAWREAANAELGAHGAMLMVASASHRRWMVDLSAYLRGEQGTLPPLSSDACRFGRWYHDIGSVYYSHLPEFVSLDQIHQRVHDLAAQLVAQQVEGQVAQVQAALPDLNAQSEAFLRAITTLFERVKEK